MQSQNLNNTMPSEAAVCPVGNPVGNLCPWCGELLPASKTKPRRFCSEAHEKRFKRAGCISKEKHHAKVLAATNERMSQMIWIPGTGTFFDQAAQPTEHRPSGQYVTVMQRVDVGVKRSGNVGTKSIVRPTVVWVSKDNVAPTIADVLQIAEGSLATTPRKVTHQVDENDRPEGTTLPVGMKKPSKAEVARIIAERKDYLPRPRTL